MAQDPTWMPDREAALRALIRETLAAAGDIPPDQLPHHIRARLKDQVAGNPDIDGYIEDIVAEERRKRGL